MKKCINLAQHDDIRTISCNTKDFDNNCAKGGLGKCQGCNHAVRIHWKLAEYEDTDLDPSEIAALKAENAELKKRARVLEYALDTAIEDVEKGCEGCNEDCCKCDRFCSRYYIQQAQAEIDKEEA